MSYFVPADLFYLRHIILEKTELAKCHSRDCLLTNGRVAVDRLRKHLFNNRSVLIYAFRQNSSIIPLAAISPDRDRLNFEREAY